MKKRQLLPTYMEYMLANFPTLRLKIKWLIIDIEYMLIHLWLRFKFYGIRSKYFPMFIRLKLNNTLSFPLSIETLKRISE